tara:strand:- start:1487 stop:1696 length:210 start_codon:yes stop_codon:yes gene_type:complete
MHEDFYKQTSMFLKQLSYASAKLKSGAWDSVRYHKHFMYFYEEMDMPDGVKQHKDLYEQALKEKNDKDI